MAGSRAAAHRASARRPPRFNRICHAPPRSPSPPSPFPPARSRRTATMRAAARGAGARAVAPILNEPEAQDWHSFARPQVARVTHVALDLALDFEARRIGGTATLDIQAADGAQEIVLDNKGHGDQRRHRCERPGAAVRGRPGRRDPRPAGDGPDGRGAADPHRLSLRPGRGGAAMADPAADRRRPASLSVQPGPGDPQPDLDPDPGQPRHPPDLGGADHRAARRSPSSCPATG